jgi:hypothetical protein
MEKVIKTYKLLRQDADGLHPLFIDSAMTLEVGKWYDAVAPDWQTLNGLTDGYHMIQMRYIDEGHKHTSEKPCPIDVESATLLKARWVEVRTGKRGRHVYDLGIDSNGRVTRFAHRPGWHSSREPNLPGVSMDGKVWAECEIPADGFYMRRMSINGMTPVSQPVEWYISTKIRIIWLANVKSTK